MFCSAPVRLLCALFGAFSDAYLVLHPAIRLVHFQGSQWDSVIAVRTRKLLLNMVKMYADAEQTQAPQAADSANTAVKAAQGPSLFAMAVAFKSQDSSAVKPTTAQGKGEVELHFGNISPSSQTSMIRLAGGKCVMIILLNQDANFK